MSAEIILPVLLILFAAGLTKAALGFGEALIAMPLLTLVLGVRAASPLTALMMTTITTIVLVQSWQRVDFRGTWRLMLMAAVGIPLGVWGLRELPASWIMLAMGVVLVGVGWFYLARPAVRWVPKPRWGYAFGLAAGLLGGAITAGGPPIVIYGALRRMPPQEFRATLQGCFTPLNFAILLGHALGGFWTQPVFELFLVGLPAALVGLWLGNRFHQRIPAHTFEKVVYGGIVALGVWMGVQALL